MNETNTATHHSAHSGSRQQQLPVGDLQSLPVIVHDGGVYLADYGRGILHDVDNPGHPIGFDTPLGRAITGEPVVTCCPKCGTYSLVTLANVGRDKHCLHCHRTFRASAVAGWSA